MGFWEGPWSSVAEQGAARAVGERSGRIRKRWQVGSLCDMALPPSQGFVTLLEADVGVLNTLWHKHDFSLLILVTGCNRLPVFSSLVSNRECFNIYVRKCHSFLAMTFLCIRNISKNFFFLSVLLWPQLITNTAKRFLLYLLWHYHDSPSIQMAWLL